MDGGVATFPWAPGPKLGAREVASALPPGPKPRVVDCPVHPPPYDGQEEEP